MLAALSNRSQKQTSAAIAALLNADVFNVSVEMSVFVPELLIERWDVNLEVLVQTQPGEEIG